MSANKLGDKAKSKTFLCLSLLRKEQQAKQKWSKQQKYFRHAGGDTDRFISQDTDDQT